MANQEIGGTVTFKVDGTQYSLRGTCRITLGGPNNTAIMGTDGTFVGITVKYMPGKIEVEVDDQPSLSLAAIGAVNGSTIYVKLGNGKSYIMANGVYTGDPPDLDTIEGRFQAVFSGPPLQELLAA